MRMKMNTAIIYFQKKVHLNVNPIRKYFQLNV